MPTKRSQNNHSSFAQWAAFPFSLQTDVEIASLYLRDTMRYMKPSWVFAGDSGGVLLIARGTWVIWLSIIPFLWSLIGLAAAIQLGIPEDLAMPVAGVFLARTLVWQARAGRRDPKPKIAS